MRIPVDVTRPMRTFLRTLLVCLLAPAAVAFAQETPPAPPRAAFALPKENPLTAWNKYMYGQLGNIVLRSADKMPEENYYGNLVTYMRMKNVVPPTSEQGFMPPPTKK